MFKTPQKSYKTNPEGSLVLSVSFQETRGGGEGGQEEALLG
jgi:hypothetical protein